MDVWKTLGIERTTNKKEIKKAYAKASIACHPEEHPEEFQKLHEAYELALQYAKQCAAWEEKQAISITKASEKQNREEKSEEKQEQELSFAKGKEKKQEQTEELCLEDKKQRHFDFSIIEQSKKTERKTVYTSKKQEQQLHEALRQLIAMTEPLFDRNLPKKRKAFQELMASQLFRLWKQDPYYIKYLTRKLNENKWMPLPVLLDLYQEYEFQQLEQAADKGDYLPLFSYLRPFCQGKSIKRIYGVRAMLAGLVCIALAVIVYTKQASVLLPYAMFLAITTAAIRVQPKGRGEAFKSTQKVLTFAGIMASFIILFVIAVLLGVHSIPKKDVWISEKQMRSYLLEKYGGEFEYVKDLPELNTRNQKHYQFIKKADNLAIQVMVRKEGEKYFLSDTYDEQMVRRYAEAYALPFSVSNPGAIVFWFTYPNYEEINRFAKDFTNFYRSLYFSYSRTKDFTFCFAPEGAAFPEGALHRTDYNFLTGNTREFQEWLEASYAFYLFDYEPWNIPQDLEEGYQQAYLDRCSGVMIKGADGDRICPNIDMDEDGEMTIGNFYRLLIELEIPVSTNEKMFSIEQDGRIYLFGQGTKAAKLSLASVEGYLHGEKIVRMEK